MWQVHSLAQGEKIVASRLPDGITVLFERRRGAPVFISIRLDGRELRAFDKTHLPVISLAEEVIVDFNEVAARHRNDLDWYFVNDRSIGARIWSGMEKILPTFTLWKIMNADNMRIMVSFHSSDLAEY